MKRKLILGLSLIVMCVASVFMLVGCGDITANPPTNIKYDGMTITWDAVDVADKYSVRINDGEEYTVTSNKFSYAATGSEFTVRIKAISNISGYLDSEETVKQFKPLGKIEELRIADDGTISWEAIVGVGNVCYEVMDGSTVKVSDLTSTSYSDMGVGEHTVKVRPVVQGNTDYYSLWSNSVTFKVLGQASKTAITYDNDTNKIRWDTISGAQYYEVSINGEIQTSNNTSTNYEYEAHNTSFDVQIKAIGNHSTTFDGKISDVKKFVFLETVKNVNVVDGILVWDEVNDANGYKVKLNKSKIETVTETKYEKLTAGVSIDVSIMPICSDNAYFSDWSAEKSVYILKAPIVEWQGVDDAGSPHNSVMWNLDDHDAGYTVKLTMPDEKVVETRIAKDVRVFGSSEGVAFTDVGTYKIEVRANAEEGSSTYDSKFSNAIIVTRLAAPTWVAKDYITSNKEQVSEGFTATFNKVAGATAYNLYIGNEGTTFKKSEVRSQFNINDVADSLKDEQNGGTITYKIQSIGNGNGVIKGGQLNVVLNSLDMLTFEITVLPTPQVEKEPISGTIYYYGAVEGNNGYGVLFDGKTEYSNDTTYDLSDITAGNHTVQVCAEGNGHEILASNYSVPTKIYRFVAPYNIRMSGKNITFSTDNNKDGYEVEGYTIQYNHSGVEENVKITDNIYDKISTEGTAVAIKAKVSKYTVNGTYLMSSNWSKEDTFFTKLQAPGFGDQPFTDTEFRWNTPSNAGTWKQKYVVYKGNTTEIWNDGLTSTSMDITFIPEGENVFAVKAIGDGVRYIDSDLKEEDVKSIYKLSMPTLTRENGEEGAQYTWEAGESGNSYSLYIDGKLVANEKYEGGKTYVYTPNFAGNQTKTIQLYAIGDGGLHTIKSSPCVINQTIAQLTVPAISVQYSEESYSTTGKIIVNITKEAEFGSTGVICSQTKYSYSIGNATEDTKELSYSRVPTSVGGEIKVKAFALGGVFDNEGVYYLASKESNTVTMYIYSSVDLSNVSVSGGGLMKLNLQTSYKYGLDMLVSIDGGEYGEIIHLSQSSYKFDNYSEIQTLKIKVRACGNGDNYITSEWTEKELKP